MHGTPLPTSRDGESGPESPTLDPPFLTHAAATATVGYESRATGYVTAADTVTISVRFSEEVHVTGELELEPNEGGAATYLGGEIGNAAVAAAVLADGVESARLTRNSSA